MTDLDAQTLDFITEPLFILNSELNFTNANKAYTKLTSCGLSELVGKPFNRVCSSDMQGSLGTALQNCLKTGAQTRFRDYGVQTNRWYEYSVTPCSQGLSVLMSDITAEQETKNRLSLEEKRWKAILEGSALGHIQIHLDGRWLYVNQRASEILGQPAAELLGRSAKDFFLPQEFKAAEEKLVSLLRGPRSQFTSELTIVRRDGREIWVRLSVSLIRNKQGQPEFFVAVVDNIDERKEIEESLHFAMQAAQLGDWDFDAVQNTTRRSAKFNEIFGRAEATWGFDDFAKHVLEEDREQFTNLFVQALTGAEEFKIDTRIVRPDQSVRWISLRGRVYLNRQGRAVRMAGLIVDVTDEKTSEQEIQHARLAAEDANREKSYFLANMSHEIRTPLAAILGFTDALRDSLLPENERQRYLDILSRNGKNLANLINDILDLSKVEAGFLEIDPGHVNIRELVEEVTSSLRMIAEAKKLKLVVKIDGILPSFISTDAIRLRQILLNVIGNAIKFTHEGEVCLRVSIVKAEGQNPAQIFFRVVDTGTGISPAAEQKLFNPFMQADSSTTRKFGGTGLGLALSRRLARAMKGNLVLESSKPGQGSSFALSLPLTEVSREEVIIAHANHQALTNGHQYCGLKGLRVLVADDSLDNQELIVRMLDKHGAEIELADDGVEAVEKALDKRYDIVLMDMQMPRLDGYSATRELRRAGFDGPILALTANAMRSDRDKCLEAGCSDYLSKPIEANKLYQLMGSLTEAVSR